MAREGKAEFSGAALSAKRACGEAQLAVEDFRAVCAKQKAPHIRKRLNVLSDHVVAMTWLQRSDVDQVMSIVKTILVRPAVRNDAFGR